MKREGSDIRRGRRDFLRLAGLGTVAAASAAVVGGERAEAATAAVPRRGGYRESEQVRTYYQLARF